MLQSYFNEKIAVYGIKKIKKHALKQKITTIYGTVQYNKCIVCSKLNVAVSKHLRRQKKGGWACPHMETRFPTSVNKNWPKNPTPVSSSCFKGS